MTLGRWLSGRPDLGPFRFHPDYTPHVGLALRLAPDGQLRDPEGRPFCTPAELDRIDFGGRLAIVVRREAVAPGPDGVPHPTGPEGLRVIFPDARHIDTPEAFRARLLGGEDVTPRAGP